MSDLVINGKFLGQPLTGVQRFAVEICRHLVRIYSNVIIVVPHRTNCTYDDLRPHLEFHGDQKGTLWEQIDLLSFMRQHGGILLNLGNTAPLLYDNNIVTIHDLGVYQNRKWYDRSFVWWYKTMTPIILKRSKAILTVSQFSKSEIKRIFNIPDNRISIVYNGLAEGFGSEIESDKEALILHVGTFSERKNVNFIVEAFRKAQTNGYKLIFCGNFDDNLLHTMGDLSSSENIEFKTEVTDKALNQLYAKARYIICASHYEGFGLPILEGIAHRLTPILSDIPVFRERYDNGSLFFNPNELNELSNVFSDLPDAYTCPSDKRVNMYRQKYSYRTSAQTIIELIESQ